MKTHCKAFCSIMENKQVVVDLVSNILYFIVPTNRISSNNMFVLDYLFFLGEGWDIYVWINCFSRQVICVPFFSPFESHVVHIFPKWGNTYALLWQMWTTTVCEGVGNTVVNTQDLFFIHLSTHTVSVRCFSELKWKSQD